MKKNIKKLQLKKKTVVALLPKEQKAMNGGLTFSCVCSRRVCSQFQC